MDVIRNLAIGWECRPDEGFRLTTEHDSAAPPRPPLVAPRLSLTRKQFVGIPLLAAIPLLTLLGVFGEERSVTRVASSALEMRVVYPSRLRYRQIGLLEITVRNVSGHVLDTVALSLDTGYVTRFSSVRIDPAPRVAYVVALTEIKPLETRLVAAELWGQDYGSHTGTIGASTRGDSVSSRIRTFVFP
jgi:hypothetical protein